VRVISKNRKAKRQDLFPYRIAPVLGPLRVSAYCAQGTPEKIGFPTGIAAATEYARLLNLQLTGRVAYGVWAVAAFISARLLGLK
jgi:hypothetical protein